MRYLEEILVTDSEAIHSMVDKDEAFVEEDKLPIENELWLESLFEGSLQWEEPYQLCLVVLLGPKLLTLQVLLSLDQGAQVLKVLVGGVPSLEVGDVVGHIEVSVLIYGEVRVGIDH
mmetsp:Transcript_33877/g.32969  ORF Transcript_33877/g.32969 Transcript_33877/m.32969 type:complete len:117 (+) Transcript_33877:649-999(+)